MNWNHDCRASYTQIPIASSTQGQQGLSAGVAGRVTRGQQGLGGLVLLDGVVHVQQNGRDGA